ncbi:MAG: ABC transporter permease, partial [Pseudomonadota bacterium]
MLDYMRANRREVIAGIVLIVLLVAYLGTHPRGASTYVMTIWANQCLILGLAACAQFFAVVVRGIDLSVGAVMALTNCIASYFLDGTGLGLAFGMVGVVLAGALCGLFNGLIIVFGRIQPIVVTLATASIFVGLALLLRPTPGGAVNYDLADAMTLDLFGVPTALILTGVAVFGFWLPFRRTGLGLGLYALGSS